MLPTARSVSLAILNKVERSRLFADDALDHSINKASPSKLDRALIHELVYGVLRYRETLDWRLNLIATRSMARLPVPVAMVLRLGAYQILYLDRIPQSASVNESVKLSRSIGGRDWTGFVNGVLRSLIRQSSPPWPDISQNLVEHIAIRYSCPRWMVERWLAFFGPTQTERLCQATLRIPPITLRTNTLRCTREELATRLRDAGHEVQETTVSPVGLILNKCGPLSEVKAFMDGWCYVEDEAAQLIPLIVDAKPHHRVLDVCAAPGGKTTHLSALMQNQGTVVALDSSPLRLRSLTSNCQRLGAHNVSHFVADASQDLVPLDEGSPRESVVSPGFDRILCDAPCSGLGVLRRHPEGKWAKGPESMLHAQGKQLGILHRIGSLLRPGGVLVYSACSTEPEETYEVLGTFCREHPEFHSESVDPWIPAAGQSLIDQEGHLFTAGNPHNMDGFFAARLRKVVP